MDVPRTLFDDRPKFAFVHLNRVGGNSFRQVLQQQFDLCKEARLNSMEDAVKFAALPATTKASYDLVGGHVSYGFDWNLPRRFEYVTLLREPVSRLVSSYSNMMVREDHRLGAKLRNENFSLLDFARCKEADVVSFAQSQLLGLGNSRDFPRDQPVSMAALFEAAVQNLLCNFGFVGVMERFDDCLDYLRDGRGMKIDPVQLKATPPSKKQETSQAERDEIAQCLEAEIQLYQLANQLLDHRMGEAGLSPRPVT